MTKSDNIIAAKVVTAMLRMVCLTDFSLDEEDAVKLVLEVNEAFFIQLELFMLHLCQSTVKDSNDDVNTFHFRIEVKLLFEIQLLQLNGRHLIPVKMTRTQCDFIQVI